MKETHFLEMMRAVQPHVSGRPKRSVELMIQSVDLLHCYHQYQEPSLSACDIEPDSIDFEAMLTDLQPVCTPPEAELVNLILNFFRSRKIYSAYRTVLQQNLSAADSSQNTNTNQAENTPEPSYTSDNASSAREAVSTNYNNNLQASSSEPPLEQNRTGNSMPQNNNTFRNLMENHAFQSLLSPTQKENLNQIGNLMQAMHS